MELRINIICKIVIIIIFSTPYLKIEKYKVHLHESQPKQNKSAYVIYHHPNIAIVGDHCLLEVVALETVALIEVNVKVLLREVTFGVELRPEENLGDREQVKDLVLRAHIPVV